MYNYEKNVTSCAYVTSLHVRGLVFEKKTILIPIRKYSYGKIVRCDHTTFGSYKFSFFLIKRIN